MVILSNFFSFLLIYGGLRFWDWGHGLGFWGWGFQLMGFGDCGLSGFFGVRAAYINIEEYPWEKMVRESKIWLPLSLRNGAYSMTWKNILDINIWILIN